MLRWRLKVLGQFALSHVPGGEAANYRLQALAGSHSERQTASRVAGYASRLRPVDQCRTFEGATVLEVGTGWEPTATILVYLMGATQVLTYDHVRHLRFACARQVVEQIAGQTESLALTLARPRSVLTERLAPLLAAGDLSSLLTAARIQYEAPADATNTGLPDDSVDIFFSYAVLAHLSRAQIRDLTVEAKRVLRDGGIAYHGIGLQDPYAKPGWGVSKVNFLRYRQRWWGFFVDNKISSNNRLRERQFIEIFTASGGHVERLSSDTDPADLDALHAMRVDSQFQGLTPAELAVNHTELIVDYSRLSSARSGPNDRPD